MRHELFIKRILMNHLQNSTIIEIFTLLRIPFCTEDLSCVMPDIDSFSSNFLNILLALLLLLWGAQPFFRWVN